MTNILFLISISLNLICLNESAKILGVFPFTGYSQYILGSALMKGLAEKGHDVTVISCYSQKKVIANYKEVILKSTPNKTDGISLFNEDSKLIFTNIIELYRDIGLPIIDSTLKDENVQSFLNSNAAFDLIISEIFHNEALMGLSYYYKAPIILFSSIGPSEWSNHLVSNPSPLSYNPIIFSNFNNRMGFWQRFQNAVVGLFEMIYKHLYIYRKQNEMLKKYFAGTPDLYDLIYNASLILLNSNVAVNGPAPLVNSMIEIGGFHISPEPLPLDLKKILDEAKDGAIFFSMGTNLKSSELPNRIRKDILGSFSKLKATVLWKWEGEELKDKAANVVIRKWMPQQDILAHPNVRAFISHAGLLSITESVHNGVPMICVPIFGDQTMNCEKAVSDGYAVKLKFREIDEDSLTKALNEVLNNSTYREVAQKRSRIMNDVPIKPMDKAIFWIEYVLRHSGAFHLRSAALDLCWYQYLLLDVMIFALGVLMAFIMFFRMLCRVCKKLLNSKSNKVKSQ